MTLNGAPLVSVAPGSIILPDTTRAFAILANCKAEPLITLPLEQNPSTGTTIAGGRGPRNPVRVVPGQSQNTQQVSGVLVNPYATAGVLFRGLAFFGSVATPTGWAILGTTAIFVAGDVVYQAYQNRQAAQIDATEAGQIVLEAQIGPSPSDTETKEGITRNNTEEAKRLSQGGPGNCNDNQHKTLQDRVNTLCKPPISGLFRCVPGMSLEARIFLARVNASCARAREELNRQCYARGDADHRQATQEAWNAARNCLGLPKFNGY